MLGAIVGDIVGSVHEFKSHPTKTKEFGPLFVDNFKEKTGSGLKIFSGGFGHKVSEKSHFTDDTVCTVGIANWLLDDRQSSVQFHLRNVCSKYPRRGYGGMFSKWVNDTTIGPYNSWGMVRL